MPTWKKREDENREIYDLEIDNLNRISGYVSSYSVPGAGFNWQAIRGDNRLYGSETTAEEAMRRAEEHLALTIEDFNARVVADLLEDLHELEKKILAIQPNITLLPGYHTRYEKGIDDVLNRILTALDELRSC